MKAGPDGNQGFLLRRAVRIRQSAWGVAPRHPRRRLTGLVFNRYGRRTHVVARPFTSLVLRLPRNQAVQRWAGRAMREIRTLRATWRRLETCGSGPPGHTGAPALDPTDERGNGALAIGPSYRAHPRLYPNRHWLHGSHGGVMPTPGHQRLPRRPRRDCAAIHPSDAGNAIPRDGRGVVSIRRPRSLRDFLRSVGVEFNIEGLDEFLGPPSWQVIL
jgi:hypothetical protein